MSLNRNVFYSLGSQVPLFLTGVVSGIFLTRVLGPAGRGAFAVFNADIELMVLFLGFSVPSILIYQLSSNAERIPQLIAIGIISLFISMVILFVLFFFFPPSFMFPGNYVGAYYASILIAIFFCVLLSGMINAIFQGRKLFSYVNYIALISNCTNLILIVAFFLWENSSFMSENVVAIALFIYFLVQFITASIWIFLYRKHIRIKPNWDISISRDISPAFSFILISHLSTILNFINYRFDLWMVEYYCDTEQVGYYSLAVNLAQILWMISHPIATVILPYLKESSEKNIEIIKMYSRINMLFLIIAFLLLFLLAGVLVPLFYGEEFVHSLNPLRILLVGTLISGLGKVFTAYTFSKGWIKLNLIATLVGAVITIIFDFWFIPIWGIQGASIASVLSYFSIFLIVVIPLFVWRELPSANYFIPTRSEFDYLKKIFYAIR